jgi:hypothetical protein
MDLTKLTALTANGSLPLTPSRQDQHFLRGFSFNTLLSYNAAVKKFVRFKTSRSQSSFVLPLSEQDIVDFVYWAGRNTDVQTPQEISAITIQKYVYGLQAWHEYHNATFPFQTKKRVAIMLRSSAKVDAQLQAKPKKAAIHLHHLMYLAHKLHAGNPKDKTVLDLAIVAFWGMARLAELTYANERGPIQVATSVLTTDVTMAQPQKGSVATLHLRNAKTCKPGEVQTIQLRRLDNLLCPVAAIERRLAEAKQKKTSLFGYTQDGHRTHLTRNTVISSLSRTWKEGSFLGLSGHSFRVGGASLRFALAVPIDEICKLGRWKSNCYMLYIREYSPKEKTEAVNLLREISSLWKKRTPS